MPSTSVQNLAATAAATSVLSGNYTAGGNLIFNNTVSNTPTVENMLVSDWLARMAQVNQYAIQKETYEKVAPGTCSWILEETKFQTWVSQSSGVFWGVGMPGAGKTVLTSFIVHHLQEREKRLNAGPTTVFYCRYSDDASVFNILASLLHQLVDSSKLIECQVNDTLFDRSKKERTQPTQSELASTLRIIAAATTSFRVVFVLDALDELNESVRGELLDILVPLRQHLFVTSRELSLEGLLHPHWHIQIRTPDRDLRNFIIREIGRLPKLQPLLQDRKEVLFEVVNSMLRKSDGMFLLTTLQVSALAGITTIKSLRRAIQTLPTTLTDMYQSTLTRIIAQSEEERSLALRTLLWATCSVRPLRPDELLAALSIELDSTELDPEAVANEKTVVSVCYGLVSINRDTGVQLIRMLQHEDNDLWTHTPTDYTAYDFFKGLCEHSFDDPHTFAATICAVYRGLSAVDSIEKLNEFTLQKLAKERYPFIEYALLHLGYHTYQSTLLQDGEIPSYVQHFLSKQSSLHLSIADSSPNLLCDRSSSFDRCHVAHFAALHGLLRWFEENLNPHAFNKLSTGRLTPLICACAEGHMVVAEFLLETGSIDIDAEDVRQNSALSCAINGAHTSLVELLLERGASVLEDPCALEIVSETGHVELARVLLDHPDYQTNTGNVLNRFILHTAAFQGHIKIVRLLLDRPEVDFNLPDRYSDDTPLLIAIMEEHSLIAKLLLELPGIDYHARDEDGFNALHLATFHQQEEIVKILLGTSDFDINARDDEGRTALHLACEDRSEKFLRLLLQCDKIDINAKDENGWTPFHTASYSGSTECVLALLEKGSGLDIHAKTLFNEDGGLESMSAVDLASRRRHTEVVHLLLRLGVCFVVGT